MDKILEILQSLHEDFDYKNSSDYIEDGLLDSFDMISLVSYLDEEFGISIDGLDIVPENFCNAKAIAELVKRSGGAI